MENGSSSIKEVFIPQTESRKKYAGYEVAEKHLGPPNPKGSGGSKFWVVELNETDDGLVDEQDDQEDGQEDAVLLQGDQGLAQCRDFMTFGLLLGGGVEVEDAQEKEEADCQENQLWLQGEGLEVLTWSLQDLTWLDVGDLFSTAKLTCRWKGV